MAVRPWVWIVIAAALAVAGVAWLFRDGASCALLDAQPAPEGESSTPGPPPLALDEARTRSEAPRLAALLNEAVLRGYASITDEREARAGRAYLDSVAGDSEWGDGVQWRGERVVVRMAVC